MQHVITVTGTFFLALILQCTTHEFLFIAGYKVSHFSLKEHPRSVTQLHSVRLRGLHFLAHSGPLPKLEQGEEVQQNYGKKAGWHKLAKKFIRQQQLPV